MSAEGFNYNKIDLNIQRLVYSGVNVKLILPPSLNFNKIPNKSVVVPFIEENLPKVVEMINTANLIHFKNILDMRWYGV